MTDTRTCNNCEPLRIGPQYEDEPRVALCPLHAAAGQMLEALEGASEQLDIVANLREFSIARMDTTLKQARAAIASAKGENGG